MFRLMHCNVVVVIEIMILLVQATRDSAVQGACLHPGADPILGMFETEPFALILKS